MIINAWAKQEILTRLCGGQMPVCDRVIENREIDSYVEIYQHNGKQYWVEELNHGEFLRIEDFVQ